MIVKFCWRNCVCLLSTSLSCMEYNFLSNKKGELSKTKANLAGQVCGEWSCPSAGTLETTGEFHNAFSGVISHWRSCALEVFQVIKHTLVLCSFFYAILLCLFCCTLLVLLHLGRFPIIVIKEKNCNLMVV